MRKTLVVRACAVGDFVLNLPVLTAMQSKDCGTCLSLVGTPSTLALAREFVAVEAIYSVDVQPWPRLFYETIELEFDQAVVWMKDPVVADHLLDAGIPNVIRADPFPSFGHAADHLLRTLGLPRPALPDLWKPASSDIVIHPGSGSPAKNWPFFEELMQRLPEGRLLPQDRSLAELSGYLRTVAAFIGNDSGITHLAAYLG